MNLLRFRHSSLARFATVLALWGLLFPALVPLLHSPAAMASPAVPICHMAMGAMDGHQAADHSPAKTKPVCPICQALAGLAQGFVAPVVADLATPYGWADAPFVPDQDRLVSSHVNNAWPRGPPTLA